MPTLTPAEQNAVEGLTYRLKADMALPEHLILDGPLRARRRRRWPMHT